MHEGLRPILRTQHPFAIYEDITCDTTGSVYIWKSHELEPPLIPVEPGSSVSGYEIPDCTCLLSSGASPDTWQFSIPQFVRCGLLDFFMRYLTEEALYIIPWHYKEGEVIGKICEESYEKVQKICDKDKVYENERSKVQKSKIRSKTQDFLIEETRGRGDDCAFAGWFQFLRYSGNTVGTTVVNFVYNCASMTAYALVLRPVLRRKPKPSGDYMNRKEFYNILKNHRNQ
ncbi:uncharacterized protein LOC122572245 [Bombus pyrosoma]|uniref:uncharacterized protein LOC122572245 n=1 Tax=Bombus pyrosoma TaxID=396416 RepID=UPI001CB99001|nr:uncharacterized protein LOC122572245 [Bombus pyrosoma]